MKGMIREKNSISYRIWQKVIEGNSKKAANLVPLLFWLLQFAVDGYYCIGKPENNCCKKKHQSQLIYFNSLSLTLKELGDILTSGR